MYETCVYLLQQPSKKKYTSDFLLAILKNEDLDTPMKHKAITSYKIEKEVWPCLEALGICHNDAHKDLKRDLRKKQLQGENASV